MKLSIIIRTFNRLEYLVRTIISIDKNSGLNKNLYEIIVVDQGSTDGTREWLNSIKNNGYYPVRPIFMESNVGDGLGMQAGIEYAKGEFIAQQDDDAEILSSSYYNKLICLYENLEEFGNIKVCALGGSHKQGVNINSAPFRFAEEKHRKRTVSFFEDGIELISTAWCTASFIFRRKFTEELEFGKGMCNQFCGHFFDEGYENFVCKNLKFWHIDSGITGAHVQRQYDKFPNYDYVLRHYKNFVKRK